MRHPTPVTTSAITIESGSTRRFTSATNDPTWIHDHTCWRITRFDEDLSSSVKSSSRPTTNDAPTATDASTPESRIRLPNAKTAIDPANGSAGISQITCSTRSPPQQARVVDVRGTATAEQGDDDGQADHHLGRRD